MLESQTQSEKFNQTSYRQNLLDAKAFSSIKYKFSHLDGTKSKNSSKQDLAHLK
jgi:hypothetical protein